MPDALVPEELELLVFPEFPPELPVLFPMPEELLPALNISLRKLPTPDPCDLDEVFDNLTGVVLSVEFLLYAEVFTFLGAVYFGDFKVLGST